MRYAAAAPFSILLRRLVDRAMSAGEMAPDALQIGCALFDSRWGTFLAHIARFSPAVMLRCRSDCGRVDTKIKTIYISSSIPLYTCYINVLVYSLCIGIILCTDKDYTRSERLNSMVAGASSIYVLQCKRSAFGLSKAILIITRCCRRR